jgi:hypothetical protein
MLKPSNKNIEGRMASFARENVINLLGKRGLEVQRGGPYVEVALDSGESEWKSEKEAKKAKTQ